MSNKYSFIEADKTEEAISLALDNVLAARGESRSTYAGMTDAQICRAIARKVQRRSPVASVALRTGASALGDVRKRHNF